MKKIVFVTHEFGLFPGHGGVASYLQLLVSKILERKKNYQVYVLSICYDKKNELLENKNLTVLPLDIKSYNEQGIQVLQYLKKIKPDYVECTDYLSLGLESLVYRAETSRNELTQTVFVTLHHTASRECYEWNDKVSVSFAPYHIREAFVRERTQMKLSDLNIAPSEFMNKYVSKNYNLHDVITVSHPLLIKNNTKENILNEVSKKYDLSQYEGKFIVNCISRIEGRKNQMLLVKQFIEFLKDTGADAYLILVGNSSINTVTLTDFKQEIYDIIPIEYRDNILFYDFMGSNGKQNILAISDITILASTFECLSLAMTESVCFEVPVLTSKYCGFVDYMKGCTEQMTFDPFEENSLCDKIKGFYNLSRLERKRIIKLQKDNLLNAANFSLTVDKRLEIYEKATNTNKGLKKNTFIIDEQNFQDIIDEQLIEKNYDSILIYWDKDKSNSQKLVKLFNALDSHFLDDDIICFGGKSTYLYFIDLIVGYISFYIKGAKFKKEMLGTPIWKILIDKFDEKKEIYCLQNKDYEVKKINKNDDNINFEKREYFRKCILESLFYRKNKINLEDYYAE